MRGFQASTPSMQGPVADFAVPPSQEYAAGLTPAARRCAHRGVQAPPRPDS